MTPTENLILSWVGRTTSTISFFSSLSMVYMIFSDRRRRLAKSNHRLMLGLSIIDCFQSAASAMTTMAIPVEDDTYGNMGNSATCTAQGFFLVLGLGVPMYNTSLSILYLLTIRHGMSATIFSTKVEPFLHVTSVMVPIAAAILAVSKGFIEPGPTVCFISRGPESITWIWIGIGIVGTCLCVCIYSMASICDTVIRRQRRMRRYSYTSATKTKSMTSTNVETRDTVIQALLYISAFILTFLFPAISFGYNDNVFFLRVLAKTSYPLQGLWNFLLYIRPGVKKIRREHPGKNIITILWEVIFHAKNRSMRERQKRHNCRNVKDAGTPHSPIINLNKVKTDSNTDMIQSNCLKCDELIKGVMPRTILGDEKYREEDNCLHNSGQTGNDVSAVEDGYESPTENEDFPWIFIPRGHMMENNGGDTTENNVRADNIASISEADNAPQVSSLYMEDKDLEAVETNNTHETQLLELNHCLDQRPLGLRWDELEGSDGSMNHYIVGDLSCSSTSSKSQLGSEVIVDDSLPLANDGNVDCRANKRRASLVNLATISPFYDNIS